MMPELSIPSRHTFMRQLSTRLHRRETEYDQPLVQIDFRNRLMFFMIRWSLGAEDDLYDRCNEILSSH